MKIQPELQPGRYVIAVSGGVDSMVLLQLLAGDPRYKLTAAHYDHGIRPDSGQDRQLVKEMADMYGLPFVYAEGHLGADASEDTARQARYGFLLSVRQAAGAEAIVTAHHQDDVLETALLNIMRGTGRRGLSSLRSTKDIVRPLLGVSKKQIYQYAREHDIRWREDSTNADPAYRRNYVRQQVTERMTEDQRQVLLDVVLRMRTLNDEIDAALLELLRYPGKNSGTHIKRARFILLPHDISREAMTAFLRSNGVRGFDRPTVERLVQAAKTALPGKRVNVGRSVWLHILKEDLALEGTER